MKVEPFQVHYSLLEKPWMESVQFTKQISVHIAFRCHHVNSQMEIILLNQQVGFSLLMENANLNASHRHKKI